MTDKSPSKKLTRDKQLEQRLMAELGGLRIIAPEVLCYGSVSSTMDIAWKMINEGEPLDGTVIIAKHQTNGRGRYNREWFSPEGGVWLSIITYLSPGCRSSLLSLVAGVASCGAIQQYLPKASIKWVNDVIYKDKKLCGVLIESNCNYHVVGIGVDTNITKFPDDLSRMATSTEIESGRIDNEEFIKLLLERFDRHYQHFKKGLYKEIIDEYKSMTSSLEKRVTVKQIGGSFDAKTIDIDETGALIVFSEEWGSQRVIEGEIIYL